MGKSNSCKDNYMRSLNRVQIFDDGESDDEVVDVDGDKAANTKIPVSPKDIEQIQNQDQANQNENNFTDAEDENVDEENSNINQNRRRVSATDGEESEDEPRQQSTTIPVKNYSSEG